MSGHPAETQAELVNGALRAGSAEVALLRAELVGLQRAMETRSVIEQAKGMLIERRGCTAGEAFAELVALSQSSNRKLHDVAAEQVHGATH